MTETTFRASPVTKPGNNRHKSLSKVPKLISKLMTSIILRESRIEYLEKFFHHMEIA